MKIYQKPIEELAHEFKTNIRSGLNTDEALFRLKKHGENLSNKNKRENPFIIFFDHLKDPFIIIFLLSAISLVASNHVVLGIAIFITLFINLLYLTSNEIYSNRLFDLSSDHTKLELVKVRRQGKLVLIPHSEVTVGDIIFVSQGDKIPADGRIVSSENLMIDESILSEENLITNKNSAVINDEDVSILDQTNMLFAETMVSQGSGFMLVTSIGSSALISRLPRIKKTSHNSPLQEKLSHTGKRLGILSILSATLIFLIEIYRTYSQAGNLSIFNFDTIFLVFVSIVAIIIACIPRDFSLFVSIAISHTFNKFFSKILIVRNWNKIEKLATIDTICLNIDSLFDTRKTGISSTWHNGSEQFISKNPPNEMLLNFCVNSTAHLIETDFGYLSPHDSYDAVLLNYSKTFGVNYENHRNIFGSPTYSYLQDNNHLITSRIFTVNGIHKMFSKGAPENILRICDRILLNGAVVHLKQDLRDDIISKVNDLQTKGKTVIAFSYKEMFIDPDWSSRESVEYRMIFHGFVAFDNVLNQESTNALSSLINSGFTMIMMTELNKLITQNLLGSLGSFFENATVVSESEVSTTTDVDLSNSLEKPIIFTDVSPNLKTRIVKLLNTRKQPNLYIGNLISDSQAMSHSTVSVSYISNSPSAVHEASDLISLDNPFITLQKCINWGRNVYKNFQRFIQYQLTILLVLSMSNIILEARSESLIFNIPQLLWFYLIMGGVIPVLLAKESSKKYITLAKPRLKNLFIVVREILPNAFSSSLYMLSFVAIILYTDILKLPSGTEQTVIFTLVSMFIIFNSINCKEPQLRSIFTSLHSNLKLIVIVPLLLVIQYMFTQYTSDFFGLEPLGLDTWLKLTVIASSLILFSEFVKFVRWIKFKAKKSK